MESPAKPRLLEQVSRAARLRHLSICPEEAYRNWIRRFVRFHGTRHPKALGPEEVRTFLSSLAT
ncbi:MAG: site-specific integrase, partial [Solirubrobacterales bacterium]